MSSSSGVVKLSLSLLVIVFLMCAVLIRMSAPAFAASTEVSVGVCSSGAGGSTITIDSPGPSPYTAPQGSVQLGGAVSNATQIDIFVNGSYSATVPLDAGQTTYQTTVSVGTGTTQLRLVANDICQIESGEASLIVVRSGVSVPGGPTEPTPQPPSDPQGEIGSGVQIRPVDGVPATAAPDVSAPGGNPLQRPLEDLARHLDLDATVENGGPWVMMARFSGVTLGLTSLVFGPQILSWVASRGLPFGIILTRYGRVYAALRLFGLTLFASALLL